MKTNSNIAEPDAKRHFSKIDASGTDPNRYGSIFNEDEAEQYINPEDSSCASLIPGVKGNISTIERILTVAAGTYLLYSGLSGKHKSVAKTLAGGTLLARGIGGYCPVYDAVGNSQKLSGNNVNIHTTVTIDRPVDEVYSFWRNLENLPRFMSHLEKVEETNGITSEWTAKGPAGIGRISWTAQILMDEKNELLSWHSLPDATVENAGKVRFTDNGDSTDLDITISYHAPLGIAGEAAAKLLNPVFEKMLKKDIDSLKTFLETEPGIAPIINI
ncbi:SRPBCC family protein [Flavobacterium sp. 3HN19-14]|uniref:SRPBCC family protein n=1 Tax=Flavobacterium sp. 3HN19-14 TaxID=3448133 RepID=UPI003EE13D09